jgi:glycosyltransferase involved in cell wall biosynthesis
MQGQLKYLRRRGFDVTVISSPGKGLDQAAQKEKVQTVGIPMERGFASFRDLVSLWHLWRNLRALGPAVVNVSTPKAGLLGGFASWLVRVPCRFYTLRGLRFETQKGLRRHLLIWAEILACRFAHRVICVSHSVREKAIASGLTTRKQTVVFGSGSSNGVDTSRFAPTPLLLRQAAELRSALGIPASATVVGFVGRLTRDKGVAELAEAFLRLDQAFPDLRLLLVGNLENQDALAVETRECLQAHPHIILAGTVDDTAPYYALMDIFVLPSHREGFPNVVLEALAAAKPVVAAQATGIVDAISDGKNGLLFPARNGAALTDALRRLLIDKALADQLARAGQEQVQSEFRQELIWGALYDEYIKFLQMRGMCLPLPSSRNGRQASRAI